MSKQEHDAAVAEYRREISNFDKPWYKSCLNLLKKEQLSGLTCLDLCCGNGEFAQILKEQLSMEVVCADYIPYHLSSLEQLGFETMQIDIDAAADQVDKIAADHSGRFDLVVSLATIEHVFNSDNLLRFAHSVLKPGGYLLVNTPNIGFAAYRFYSLFSGNRPFGEGHHVRFWDFRFLRTNLFLNGFKVIADGRQFFSLPQDAVLRAFRNKARLAGPVAWLFHACQILQHIPFLRGLCSDELTVLAQKEDVPAMGFELNTVRKFLQVNEGSSQEALALERLNGARKSGWLDEHLYLSELVDELMENQRAGQ